MRIIDTVTTRQTIARSARTVLAVAGLSLLVAACGSSADQDASTTIETAATDASAAQAEAESSAVGHVSVTALRVGGSGDQSPRVEGVPFRVLPVGSGPAVLTGTTKNRADRLELAPGSYRVVADRSAVPSGPCSGDDQIAFSIAAGEDVIVATYIPEEGFEQVPGPFCMRLVTLPTG